MTRLIMAALLFTFTGATASLGQIAQDGIGTTAKDIAKEIIPILAENTPAAGKHRIAVLQFGDSDREITQSMGSMPIHLQGTLIEELKSGISSARGNVPTSFSVLSYEQLVAIFEGSTNDPSGLSDKNISLARTVLAAENIDIAVVGHFTEKFPGNAQNALWPHDLKLEITVILPNSAPTFSISNLQFGPTSPGGTGPGNKITQNNNGTWTIKSRFKIVVEVMPLNSSNWIELPLKVVTDPNHPLFNELTLVVPEQYKGCRYRFRITNNGTTPVPGIEQPEDGPDYQRHLEMDADRVFMMAGYVDGVSIFKRRVTGPQGVISHEKDTRYYPMVTKWVFTGPGREFRAAAGTENERFAESKLVNVRGPGHSQLFAQGFVKVANDPLDSTSGVFVFGDAQNSVGAEFAGTGISQIGVMSFYFFAERLPTDLGEPQYVRLRLGGTEEGPNVPTPTIKVKIKNIYQTPKHTFHIFYMYDSPDCPSTAPITHID